MNITDFHTELSIEGFNEFVITIAKSESKTIEQAYWIAEEKHLETFNKHRYASFESFKTNRYKFLKKVTKRLPTKSHQLKTFV